MAKRLEALLYLSDPSLEAYLDTATLDARLNATDIRTESNSDRNTKSYTEEVKSDVPRVSSQTQYYLGQQAEDQRHGQQSLEDAHGSDHGHGQQAKLTLETLALATTPDARKKMIGQRLFPLILKTHELDLACKITDKLLESDNSEFLLHLLESPEALSSSIQDVLHLLESDSDIETESDSFLEAIESDSDDIEDTESDSDEEEGDGSEEGQEQQKKKFHLTDEMKVALRAAVLSAMRHPEGIVDSKLLQRAIAKGLPEKAVLNAAVVARERDANNRNAEALMTEFCKVSYMTELPLPFLEDLGRICRAIHLQRQSHRDIQTIQSDVQNSLSDCIGEDLRLNSIVRHLQDFFNSLWQEYMIPSDTPPHSPDEGTSLLHSTFTTRAKARNERLPQIASTYLSSQAMLKVKTALAQFVEIGGKADKLDENTVLGDVDNATGDVAAFIESIRALINSISWYIEDSLEYTVLELYQDVKKCYSDVFQNDISKKTKIIQRLDRILGKVFVPIQEANYRGVNRSSIWGCCAAIIWAREGEKKPYWPAIVLGM